MTPLTITDSNGTVFTFQLFEIPEELGFGGSQMLNVHKLPGGQRIVDALGPDPRPLEWAGEFVGANATTRARYLDTLRKLGQPVTVSWSQFSYVGVIAEFHGDFRQEFRIPYTIQVVVETDQTEPVVFGQNPSIDDAITGDLSAANALVPKVNDSLLTAALATLDAAIAAASSFATATQAVIQSVLTPLQQVQNRVTTLIGISSNAIGNLTTFGGVFPNNPVAINAAKFNANLANMNSLAALYPLQNALTRMGTNLQAQSGNTPASNTNTVTVAGGTLYQVAAAQYGDATQWKVIADANGLKDPVLTGTVTLKIPPLPQQAPATQPLPV